MKRTPACFSIASSFAFSASASLLLTTPAASVNQFAGCGGTSSANALDASAQSSKATRSARTGLLLSEVELDFRRFAASGRALEVRLLLEAGEAGNHARGELQDVGVVLLRGFVEAAALDGDAVLRPFELRLQLEEVLVRFQLGIFLDDDEQSRQRTGESGLRLLELLHRLRTVRDVRGAARRAAGGDLSDARTRFGDLDERRL